MNRLAFAVILSIASLPVCAIDFPETPKAKQGEALLQAVNSGKESEVRKFVHEQMSPMLANKWTHDRYTKMLMRLHEQTGTLTLSDLLPGPPGSFRMLLSTERSGRMLGVELAFFNPDSDKPELIGLHPMDGHPRDKRPLFPRTSDSPEERRKVVDGVFGSLCAKDRFSGVIMAYQDGKPLYEKACGFANREERRPNTLTTRFHTASMGKMFTGVAIAQLVEAGKLRYDSKLLDVLPEYPNQELAKVITIEQLLTHQAGLGNLFSSADFDKNRHYPDHLSQVAIVAKQPATQAPGAGFKYSNGGYVVLGAVIEKLSGLSYAEYLQRHIFDPAGMTRSGFWRADEKFENRSVGYARDSELDPMGLAEPSPTTAFFGRSRGNAAGGVFSTAGDMIKFIEALRTEKLLPQRAVATLTSPKVSMFGGDGPKTAYGFDVFQAPSGVMLGHSGGGDGSGVSGDLEWAPDKGVVVVALGNCDLPAARDLALGAANYLAR